MTAGTKGETILLVENVTEVRSAMTSQLKSLGYDVRTAASVPEAKEVLREGRRVDLMLSDIMLDRDRTGVELAKLARSADRTLKIVLMSGHADPVLTAEMTDLAELGWLAKPFDRSTLNRELRKLLD